MIRSRDVNKEVKVLDDLSKATDKDEATVIVLKAILKGIALVVKLVRDVRTNQVLGLEKAGVKLIKDEKAGAKKDAKTEAK